MGNDFLKTQSIQDFEKAKGRALFGDIFNMLRPEKKELLSFYDIKSLVKPDAEIYRGMKAVRLNDIVGSEGRYKEFNKMFLPKKEHLRGRWTSIDQAYLKDVTLPPIRLYKLGEVYFVRDGNHRVSVARSQKMYTIDAEVTELTTRITFTKDTSVDDLKKEIVNFERERVLRDTKLSEYIDMDQIFFTAPGRYDEMVRHILGHKFYMDQGKTEKDKLSFEAGSKSWFNRVYAPTAEVITEKNILSRFKSRTCADLYIWTVKEWDGLKRKYGEEYPLEEAVEGFARVHGKSRASRFGTIVKNFFSQILPWGSSKSSGEKEGDDLL